MSISYRKTVNQGKFRVNVTGAGAGLSAGVGPTRVSLGPRGINLYGTKMGFKYYQSLNPFFKQVLPVLKLMALLAGVLLAFYYPELWVPLAIIFGFWLIRKIFTKTVK